MISRRRFIAVIATVSLVPSVTAAAGLQQTITWQGHAFGAEVSISLSGEHALVEAALDAARDTMQRLEKMFSLYDPLSDLSKLNRAGHLKMPPEFSRLMRAVDWVYWKTDGLFDPTIQPVFAALLNEGLDEERISQVRSLVGWANVQTNRGRIRFSKPDMAMTLNGIAQGYATDRVTEVLRSHGFENTQVNIGEYRSGSEPVLMTIEDAGGEALFRVDLKHGAMATSSANGFVMPNGQGHILAPRTGLETAWDTVSVVASNATGADGYSTALVLSAGTELAENLVRSGEIRTAILKSLDGKVKRIG